MWEPFRGTSAANPSKVCALREGAFSAPVCRISVVCIDSFCDSKPKALHQLNLPYPRTKRSALAEQGHCRESISALKRALSGQVVAGYPQRDWRCRCSLFAGYRRPRLDTGFRSLAEQAVPERSGRSLRCHARLFGPIDANCPGSWAARRRNRLPLTS